MQIGNLPNNYLSTIYFSISIFSHLTYQSIMYIYLSNIYNSLEVCLLHKPRGSKGVFQQVEMGDKLRVTKGKGKRLKLEIKVRSNEGYNRKGVQVQLVDVENSVISRDGFTIEGIQMLESVVEIEIKLFQVCKRMHFLLEIHNLLGRILQGKSVEFSTHNSGTVATGLNTNHKGNTNSNPPNNSHNHNTNNPANASDASEKKRKRIIEQTPTSTLTNGSNPTMGQYQSLLLSPLSPQMSSLYNGSSLPPDNFSLPEIVPSLLSDSENNSNSNNNNNNTPNPSQLSNVTASITAATAGNGSSPIDVNGPVHVIPGSLEVRGFVKAKAFLQFSDLRLKTNIADIVDAIQIVTSLQGKTYQWKADNVGDQQPGGKRVVGLIAQEVQKVLPEVVHTDPETGLLTVSYAEILPILIEAFKELLKDSKEHKEEVQSEILMLRSKLESVSKELEKSKSI